MTITTVLGCGQVYNDTVDEALNNNGQPFTAYNPVGGPVATYSWESGSNAALGTLAAGQAWNVTPYLATDMSLTMTSVSTPAPTQPVSHKLILSNTQGTGAPNPGGQVLVIQPNTSYSNLQRLTDNVGSDLVPANKFVTLAQSDADNATAGTGQAIFTGIHWNAAMDAVFVPWACSVAAPVPPTSGYGGSGTSTKHYLGVTGRASSLNTICGNAQCYMPEGGIWTGMQITLANIAPNSSGQSATAHSVNSTTWNPGTPTGGQTLTISGTSQLVTITDNVGSDLVTAGNYICMYITNTMSSNIYWWTIGSTWQSSDINVNPLTSVDTPGTFGNGTNYAQIGYTVIRPGLNPNLKELPAPITTGGLMTDLSSIFTATSTGGTFSSFKTVSGTPVAGGMSGNISSTPGVLNQDNIGSDLLMANDLFMQRFSSVSSSWVMSAQAVNLTTPLPAGAHPSNMLLLDAA